MFKKPYEQRKRMESTLAKKKKKKIARRLFQLKKLTAKSTSSSTTTDSSINHGYQERKLRKKRSKQLYPSSKHSNFDHIVLKRGPSIVCCDINRNSYWTALKNGSSYQTNYVPFDDSKSQPEFQIECQFRFALQPPFYDNNQRASTTEVDRRSRIFDNRPRSRKPVILDECQTINLNGLRRRLNEKPLKNSIDELESIYNSLHLHEDDQLLDRADEIETNLQENRRKLFENQNRHLKCRKNESESEADAIKDDMFHRELTYKNQTLKIQEHQPPFGIPLRPIQFSTSTDYLNAPPPSSYRTAPLNVRNKEPDLIKDDLAYRTLRKEQNECNKMDVNLDFEYKKLCDRLLKCLIDITDLIVANNRNEKLLHSLLNLNLNLDTNNNCNWPCKFLSQNGIRDNTDINNNNVIASDTNA